MSVLQRVVLVFAGYVWGAIFQRFADGILWGAAQSTSDIENMKLLIFLAGYLFAVVMFFMLSRMTTRIITHLNTDKGTPR